MPLLVCFSDVGARNRVMHSVTSNPTVRSAARGHSARIRNACWVRRGPSAPGTGSAGSSTTDRRGRLSALGIGLFQACEARWLERQSEVVEGTLRAKEAAG